VSAVWRSFCFQTVTTGRNADPTNVIGEDQSSRYSAPAYKYCARRIDISNFTLAWAAHRISIRSPWSSPEKYEGVQVAFFSSAHT
jgi:hypothetical protein